MRDVPFQSRLRKEQDKLENILERGISLDFETILRMFGYYIIKTRNGRRITEDLLKKLIKDCTSPEISC